MRVFLLLEDVRKVLASREFRLATPVPGSYTHTFHADSLATVAQWQSSGFVNQGLWVQLPPVASRRTCPAAADRCKIQDATSRDRNRERIPGRYNRTVARNTPG